MSRGKCGVFQLMEEVTFRRIPAFFTAREKWGRFGNALSPFLLLDFILHQLNVIII
jgi:hypothetical protein